MTSESHKSFAGLIDIVGGSANLNKGFEKLFEKAVHKKGGSRNPQSICIIDTFFSDTLNDDLFISIVHKSKEKKIPIKIVLLNPFSESAIERAKKLSKVSRINRINSGLCKIKKALGGSDRNKPEFQDNCMEDSYIFKQIDQIEKLKKDNGYSNIELRFTTVGQFPLYIFGQYACSGHFLDFTTAAESPWCFWVDDVNEPKDQYSNFKNHFDEIWKNGYQLDKKHLKSSSRDFKDDIFKAPKNNKILIAYHNDTIKNVVKAHCRDNGFFPKDFKIKSKEKKSDGVISNILLRLFNECASAIIILTKDEQVKKEWRPRPNVLIELGYAQSKYPNRCFLFS